MEPRGSLELSSGIFEFFHLNWGADLGFILCMGWKVLGEKKVHLESIRDYNDGTWMDDGPLIARLQEILSGADMWVTYNGIRCDVPFLQTRLLINHLPMLPPMPHKDLIYTVRHKLKLSRNRLMDIQNAMEMTNEKTPVRMMQWLKAVAKQDDEAMDEIEHHCKQDVLVLEECYQSLAPIVMSHPRLHGYEDLAGRPVCNKCGGLMESRGTYVTAGKVNKRKLHCLSTNGAVCGGWETRPIPKGQQ